MMYRQFYGFDYKQMAFAGAQGKFDEQGWGAVVNTLTNEQLKLYQSWVKYYSQLILRKSIPARPVDWEYNQRKLQLARNNNDNNNNNNNNNNDIDIESSLVSIHSPPPLPRITNDTRKATPVISISHDLSMKPPTLPIVKKETIDANINDITNDSDNDTDFDMDIDVDVIWICI